METKTVAQGRDGCTVTAASEVVFPIRKDYYHVRNDSENTVYASVFSAELDPAEDGVYAVPAGGNIAIKSHGSDRVYVSGGVTVIGTGSAVSPFKSAQRGGDITAKGNPVQIDGLQGGVPFSEMVVSGKNLIPYPYYDGESKILNGVTFTVNADGSVTANGTATKNTDFRLTPTLTNEYDTALTLETDTFYTLSGCPTGEGDNTYYLHTNWVSDGIWYTYGDDLGSGLTFKPQYDNGKITIMIRIVSGAICDNLVFRPQLELGSIPTAYEPPITGRELTVGVSGKNVLKYPYVQTTRTSYGVTFTDNGDGSITASGTHDGGTNLSYFGFSPWWANTNGGRLFLPKGNTVTLRVMGLTDTCQCIIAVKKDNTSADSITAIYGVGESAANYTAEQDCYIACGIIGLPSSVGQAVNFTAYPQLELGDTATDYESYHGAKYTITPDSNPYTVPNDIRQLDGLNTISVSAGTLSVKGVRKNAAIKRIWDEIDEIKTAIIVSNGESE